MLMRDLSTPIQSQLLQPGRTETAFGGFTEAGMAGPSYGTAVAGSRVGGGDVGRSIVAVTYGAGFVGASQ